MSQELAIKEESVVSIPERALEFNPEKTIEQATRAASALKNIVDSKKKKVMINNEQYLEFEDWQTLGQFYGYTVETGDAEEIVRDGTLIGYKAKSSVFKYGMKIGGAEASCLRTEKNWGDKPEFQLKSMAQTRAGAKGLRNVLAWVAVLAGYRPTPAEEMTGEEVAGKTKILDKKYLSKIFACVNDLGWTNEEAKAYIYEKYNVKSTKDLSKEQAADLIDYLTKQIESLENS